MTQMSKRMLLKQAAKTRNFKEIAAAHLAIILVSGIVYLLSTGFYAALTFISLMLVEMAVFHTVWYYRENVVEGVANPLRTAIIDEIKTIVFGIVSVVGLIVLLRGVYIVTGFPPFLGLLLIGFGGVGWLMYRAYAALDEQSG